MARPHRLARLDGGTAEFLDADGNVLASGDLGTPFFGPICDGRSETPGGIHALVTRPGRIAQLVLRAGDGEPGLIEPVGSAESAALVRLIRLTVTTGEVIHLPRLAAVTDAAA